MRVLFNSYAPLIRRRGAQTTWPPGRRWHLSGKDSMRPSHVIRHRGVGPPDDKKAARIAECLQTLLQEQGPSFPLKHLRPPG